MVMYEVHVHPLLQRYKTHLCTFATVFNIITIGLTYIPPLLIAYLSQGMFIYVNWYFIFRKYKMGFQTRFLLGSFLLLYWWYFVCVKWENSRRLTHNHSSCSVQSQSDYLITWPGECYRTLMTFHLIKIIMKIFRKKISGRVVQVNSEQLKFLAHRESISEGHWHF